MAIGEYSEILLFLKGEKLALSIFLSWGLRPWYFLPPISIWQMLLSFCYHIEEKKHPVYRIYPRSLHSQTVKLNWLSCLPLFHTTLETEWTSKCVLKAFYLVSLMPGANSDKVRNASWSRCYI